MLFCVFLGLVIYAADVGVGDRYWGWLEHLPMGDKVGHCGLMFTLSLLANLSLRCRVVRTIPPTILLGTVLVTFVVLAEEFSPDLDTRARFRRSGHRGGPGGNWLRRPARAINLSHDGRKKGRSCGLQRMKRPRRRTTLMRCLIAAEGVSVCSERCDVNSRW